MCSVTTIKKITVGNHVYLSVRQEKIRISQNKPLEDNIHNIIPAEVEDVIYLGPTTKYRVRVQDYRLFVYQEHSRFTLD